jgi:3alpha(or 20beta)-hydroxysteroid dehydrogenase
MQRFTDKVILVTGAARGIGLAAVEQFALEGGIVIATDIDEPELVSATNALLDRGLRVEAMQQDVTDEARWDEIMAVITRTHGHLDVLVNNAGIGFLLSVEDTSVAKWRQMLSVNLESVFLGTRAGITAMKGRGGAIVNVASIAANIAEPLFPAYNAAKGGVGMFTKSAAVDCARKGYGVRINSLHPGYCETKLVADAVDEMGEGGEAFAGAVVAAIPFGRLATTYEIARPLLFLASDDAAYMVGSELVVDGGYIAI